MLASGDDFVLGSTVLLLLGVCNKIFFSYLVEQGGSKNEFFPLLTNGHEERQQGNKCLIHFSCSDF